MAFVDVCRFNPTAGGTTNFTYASAVTGYQSPAAAGIVNAATYSYRAESLDLTQWEIGTGTYTTATGVLTRGTVLFNSSATGTGAGQSGAGTKINFTVAPQVAIVALAEDLNLLAPIATPTFTGGSIVVSGTTTPLVLFSPASGATKNGQLLQQGDSLIMGASGVGNYQTINLNTGAATMSGALTATEFLGNGLPTSVPTLSSTGSVVPSVANGASSGALAITNGILVTHEATALGHIAVWLIEGGSISSITLGLGGTWVAPTQTPAAGKMSVAYDGSTGMRIYNNRGGASQFIVGQWQI